MRIRKLLNIPKQYKIERIKELDEEIHVWIKAYKRKKAICSHCGNEHKDHSRGIKWVTVQDLPMVGRKVYLHVAKRRYQCPEDNSLHVEEIEWIKKKSEVPIDMLKMFIN